VTKKGNLWRRDPRPGVVVVVLGVATTVFIFLVVALAAMPLFVLLDEAISEAFRSLGGDTLETLALAATWIANPLPITVLTSVTGLVLWVTGRRAEAVLIVVTVAG